MTTSIADELEAAEEHLSRALGKLMPLAGTARRTQSGRLWVGSWGDVRTIVKLLLTLRRVAKRARDYETPRQKKTRPVCS